MPSPDHNPAFPATQPGAAPESVRPAPVRVIAVASGKGGVGKTNVSVNLALSLQNAGQRTLLLDTDLGLANVDVMLGLSPRFTLADVLAGRCELRDTLLEGPGGMWIVPAASGKRHMTELLPQQHVGLVHAFSQLDVPIDTMVVDNAAGIADGVLTFCQAAQDVIVVVCDEPASVTDAYALIKVLSRDRALLGQITWLRATRNLRSLLVLPANSHPHDMNEVVRRYRMASPEGVVLTKLDETGRLGGVLSVAVRNSLNVAYTTDGQHVPSALDAADASRLVLQLEKLRRAADNPLITEDRHAHA